MTLGWLDATVPALVVLHVADPTAGATAVLVGDGRIIKSVGSGRANRTSSEARMTSLPTLR